MRAESFKRYFPRAYEYIFLNYRISQSIGHYRLMERIPAKTAGVDSE